MAVAVDVSVVVPWWRPTPDRQRLWAALRPRWQALGYEVVEGGYDADHWVKARAVDDGVRRAAGDVLVVADADVWCHAVGEAVDAAQSAGWAMPHGRVWRLTAEATTDILCGGGWPIDDPAALERRPYWGMRGGGLVVVTRRAYEAAPLDPRFVGWGGEDESWSAALKVLVGPGWRGGAPLWHLWHEPLPRAVEFFGSTESRELVMRYRAARDVASMAALVDEGRQSVV